MSAYKKSAVLSIANHGNEADIEQLLRDLEHTLLKEPLVSYSILVVISNNLQPSRFAVSSTNFDIAYIDNLRPKGFGDNHNTACSVFESDLFIVINPDVRLTENFRLGRVFDETPKCGVLTPTQCDFFGQKSDFLRKDLSPIQLAKRLFKISEPVVLESADWIPGSFMSFKTSFFCDLGGFDSGYFMYVEDCDLCRSLRYYGGTIVVQDSNVILHEGQRRSKVKISHLLWHLYSLARYFYKKYIIRTWATRVR